ncbi:MAG: DUF4293 domain-containing protein [Alistipes sp.]|nr:DUF4293 domain-containing protein [Alistipes sp.]
MIQRIQSLYLFIVAGLMVVMLSFPLGRFLAGDEEFILKAYGIYSTLDTGIPILALPYMGILITLAAALPFITIFFYKNRLLQIRLCFMEMVFLIGVQIFVVFFLYRATKSFNHLPVSSVTYSAIDVIPLVALILMWLSFRAIAKDEALVRSLDRIR